MAEIEEVLRRLPATPCITFRGMRAKPPRSAFTLNAMLPTSTDPRVATENFRAECVAAISTVSGRSISAFSRFPDDHEVVLLPGTLLIPAGRLQVADLHSPVALLAEAGEAANLPSSRTELEIEVLRLIEAARVNAPVPINAPGKYTPPEGEI